jgi:hypothetical protein
MNRTCFQIFCVLIGVFYSGQIFSADEPRTEALLDENLSLWEVWTGVPSLGLDLPAGYSRGDDPKNVPPIGLGDPFGLFSMQQDADGSKMLYVSGKSRGALTTKAEYSDYHLSLQFKWGEQDGTINRDSGVLYHAMGQHGAMWSNWKKSMELQLKEGAIGDLYLLGGLQVLANLDKDNRWDPTQQTRTLGGNTVTKIAAGINNESPLGEWTRIDVYVLGDSAVHVINGKPVIKISQIKLEGKTVGAGALQIQSGSSPCYFKDVRIRKITKLPSLSEFGG